MKGKRGLKGLKGLKQPGLVQFAFGCPTSEFECPEFIEAGLNHLASEIERVEWNRTQEHFKAPTGNNGGSYKTAQFAMRAYYWGENRKRGLLPNFKCGDFEVRWYKHLGRGMSMNRKIDANRFFNLIDKCLAGVRAGDPLNKR